VTGIFPAATGPVMAGDIPDFQPSHDLKENEHAEESQ
jgi:hypothetical protein